ncbi:MAG: TIGR02281 family clan AA aspartic protease [Pseudomonadota bacterium]|nr:TIGR02281 family clan AA aspartic protease [Pseudomonadota bacterium]
MLSQRGKTRRGIRVLLVAVLIGLFTDLHGKPKVTALGLFKGTAVLSIDGKQRVLKKGESSPEGVRLIDADANRALVEIEGREFELSLDGKISGAISAGPVSKVVRLVPGNGGHYFVDGQINGNPVRFLVDTGATSVAMNKHTARQIGIPYAVEGEKHTVRTASGFAVGYGVVLDEVKIGSLGIKGVTGTVIDGDFPSVPLLGQSFLNRLDIHRQGAVMELRER